MPIYKLFMPESLAPEWLSDDLLMPV